MFVKGYGMEDKRRATWGEERASTLYKLCKEGASLSEVYAAFPDKTQKLIKSRIFKMGFSVKQLGILDEQKTK